MPYSKISDLPKRMQCLPKHAQEIFLATFNQAWREYADASKRQLGTTLEETANRVAWAAVKHGYEKSGDKWVKK